MPQPTSITRDPLYTGIVAFFALLTTALPALLGQPNFMPILQAAVLTALVAFPLSRREVDTALRLTALWLALQFLLLTLLTRVFDAQIEQAIHQGFTYRGDITAWFYNGAPLPNSITTTPGPRLRELLGIVLGSLATAGLVGMWFLMRVVNLAAYSAGILWSTLEVPLHLLLILPYWTLTRIAAYAGLVILLAQPLLTYTWSPLTFWRSQRTLILTSLGLLLLALLLEIILPGLVARSPMGTPVG